MRAYYNDNDPFAAEWLRCLMARGIIPEGDIDERDIREVKPEDLEGYHQVHFFAGVGGWAYALRLAGWPDDRPVWTGSPPCQPFSSAGKRLGVKDERHLSPVWLELVQALRPPVLFGEQVASAVSRDNWLDDLLDALEGAGYATGAAVAPACSVGAPHIRQRLWFVASRMAEPDRGQRDRRAETAKGYNSDWENSRRQEGDCSPPGSSGAGNVGASGNTDADNVTWGGPDWLFCRDGRWRPVEPGTFPLADGVSKRVGLLRGYGNAIVPQVAAEVIRAYLDAERNGY